MSKTLPLLKDLAASARSFNRTPMRLLFEQDPQRFGAFSREGGGLFLDFSKNRVTRETMTQLARLADIAGVQQHREAMFRGDTINTTERRAVLHTALRANGASGATVAGASVDGDIARELARFLAFAEDLRRGRYRTVADGTFTDVVNIGIGGSDLGPVMATAALAPYCDGPRLHFVSNVDGAHLADTLKLLDPARTLILIASKTFTTQETMANARAAQAWLAKSLGPTEAGRHCAAISTARDKVMAFGISPDRMFGFWDWVGGRYSIWSAIGLSLAIAVGAENFRAFLAGAAAMDRHFREADTLDNLPMLLALIGIWNRNACGFPAIAILPYEQRLARFPAYLQQLDMESNGKGVGHDGKRLPVASGPVLFGEPGTNGQHAFYQLLHQGTDVVPADILIGSQCHEEEPMLRAQHDLLIANALAQTEALMRGRTLAEAKAQLRAAGLRPVEVNRLAPHKVFSGNRPTNTLVYRRLDPRTLGALIALYEHKVFVQGTIWGLNSFDQWGVELGKELANSLQGMVEGREPLEGRDSSTLGLIRLLREPLGSKG